MEKRQMKLKALKLLFVLFILCVCHQKGSTCNNHWISLFNGKDLTGWKVKITGHDLNYNFGNTFRVEDGIMKVCYDQYETFGNKFVSSLSTCWMFS